MTYRNSLENCGSLPAILLNADSQRIRQRLSIYNDRATTIEQVIAEHRDDFVHWRYVFEQQGANHVELLDLEPAVEAIIEEYSYQLRQQSGIVGQ